MPAVPGRRGPSLRRARHLGPSDPGAVAAAGILPLVVRLMGIVNVTPDSFSDGGLFLAPERAIAHAHRLVADGAELLDVGGESTRPGARGVSAEEELARVAPVLAGLDGLDAAISIDT